MPTKQDMEMHAKYWTLHEIAEYIKHQVDCGKPLDLEIVEEWNFYMTVIVEGEESCISQ